MQIGVQARGFDLTEALRDHCERRLRFALESASDKVGSVLIRLTDQNGPRGGVDKRCSIRVILRLKKSSVSTQLPAPNYARPWKKPPHALAKAAPISGMEAFRTWD